MSQVVDYTPCTYPFTSPSYFSPNHLNFIANISEIKEPTTYLEAKNSLDWIKALGEEIRALEQNSTWEICELSTDKKPIRCKWAIQLN